MRAFTCDRCGHLVFVNDDACLHCAAPLGVRPSTRQVEVLGPTDRRCATYERLGCTWLVEDDHDQCRACRLTRTWPPLDDPEIVAAVAATEQDKRRLVLQLLGLGLPVERLAFDLLSSRVGPVTIGHTDAVITIDVEEADDVRRVQLREELGEPYRTMLGHLRHEAAHGLWPSIVEETGQVERARAVFGDERRDYQQALDRHYAEGPPTGWAHEYVSAYATMHPAEDWAETVAHVLHVLDALETAYAHGLAPQAPADLPPTSVEVAGDFGAVVDAWLPLAMALNAVSRSLGQGELYPFVLAPAVVAKLGCAYELLMARGGVDPTGIEPAASALQRQRSAN